MTFFFTLLDDSLRPRGSRDPLGIELLWSGVGRRLVGNLTTVTTHLDNFILALVGFHLCGEEGQAAPAWPRFERFEQMCGRARVRRGLPAVIGIRRIQGSPELPVVLGASRAARILDDQRQAGLWGLYSTALAASGLTDAQRRPTPRGAEVVRSLLDVAPDAAWRLAVDDGASQLDAAGMARAEQWVVALLGGGAGRSALADCLLSGGGAPARWQGEVYEQGRAILREGAGRPSTRRFLAWLQARARDAGLRDFAGLVQRFDEELVLAERVFGWLLGCHGQPLKYCEETLASLRDWPFGDASPADFTAHVVNGEWHRRAAGLGGFATAMAQQRWREAIERLLEYHATIARGRGGSPWCYLEEGRVKVVMNASPATLPTATEIAAERFAGWMDGRSKGFFLGAFLDILQQAGGGREGQG